MYQITRVATAVQNGVAAVLFINDFTLKPGILIFYFDEKRRRYCWEWLSKIIHRRVTFMEFGVLKVVSVISKSQHSQESYLRVLNVGSFTRPAKDGTI